MLECLQAHIGVRAAIKAVQADIASAQTQYDKAYNAAMLQQNAGKRSKDWYGNQNGEFTLPLWYFDQKEELRAALVLLRHLRDVLLERADASPM